MHDKTTPGPPQPHHNNTPRSGLNTTPQNPGLHNVSVTSARQVVALTLSCAAGPDTWSMGTPAHTPPIGLTCASKGPGTHPSGRTCHPTAGQPRGPQHVLQPHISTVAHRARHSPNHAAHTPPQARHNPDAPDPRPNPRPTAAAAHTPPRAAHIQRGRGQPRRQARRPRPREGFRPGDPPSGWRTPRARSSARP